MLVYHSLLQHNLQVKDIRMPNRILQKFKQPKETLRGKALEIIDNEKFDVSWSQVNSDVLDAISFWDAKSIETNWFNICFQPRPPALQTKEYSPGRYRYFNLPLDPFMAVECDKNEYLSISLKHFTYLWTRVLKQSVLQGIRHFKLEVRDFTNC
mmetsp:Transcript_35522/g.41109  ORF Transcript_35522/g.41109 Transcript_35522/m.41109 type:complete len:154 (+) Transcript_35522:437-898(+)